MKIKFEYFPKGRFFSKWINFFSDHRNDSPHKNFPWEKYDSWILQKNPYFNGLHSMIFLEVEVPIHHHLYLRLGTFKEVQILRDKYMEKHVKAAGIFNEKGILIDYKY